MLRTPFLLNPRAVRKDIDKVLVEEPRHGRATARANAGSRRRLRARLDPDGEGGVTRLGMRRDNGHDKHFGEHLSPLYRWLRQQVNRPWRLVEGELAAQLDRRSVVQAHLFQHINDRVDTDTEWRDGEVWVRGWRGVAPLAEAGRDLFVHPRTGILLVNRARLAARRARKLARAQRPPPEKLLTAPHLAPDEQWHRIDGAWYALKLAELPAAPALAFDLRLRRVVGQREHAMLRALYGRPGVYAAGKRQLDGSTLRRHGLACDVEPV